MHGPNGGSPPSSARGLLSPTRGRFVVIVSLPSLRLVDLADVLRVDSGFRWPFPFDWSPVVHRPHTVAFDVVETLISLEQLRPRFVEIGLHPSTLERWFDRMLRDGMALTLAGDYEPFPAVAAAALRVIGGGRLGDGDVQHVLDGFATLPAQPDAERAMQVLADAGVAVVCLSNGARESTDAFLDRSGLHRFVEQVISVADVRMWKPPRAVYDHALSRIGRPAADVALVAVHAFDCHGAHAAGLTTGWAARLERHYAEIFTRADVIGEDLVEVAKALVALPGG